MTEAAHVLVETAGSLGRVRLNRPKALNSLTFEMVQDIAAALVYFETAPNVGAVLISGEGERGLCAGGDIRALYDHGRDGSGFGELFFRAEYRMNAHIAGYTKPYIAMMDGITMGGGVGISAHGAVRIVTERTKIAMPETGIGFFPDVGGTWLLSRSPGEIGTFIGLTGDYIGGADAIYAGLADHFVNSVKIPALIAALAAVPTSVTHAEVRAIVDEFVEPVVPPLGTYRTEIDNAFAYGSVEKIDVALEKSGSEFARKTLGVMAQKSPISMKVTLKLLRLARQDICLEDSLEREFTAGQAVLASDEFYEGVRALVVDKDRTPKWSPATLAEVTDELVDKYFSHSAKKIF